MPNQFRDPESFLPLSNAVFQILVTLAGHDSHGYSIMRDVAERTGGQIRLSPGTLYGSIRRLLEDGLIREMEERPDAAYDDERRRYYRLTELGHGVARAEARRLSLLVCQARAHGLLAERS